MVVPSRETMREPPDSEWTASPWMKWISKALPRIGRSQMSQSTTCIGRLPQSGAHCTWVSSRDHRQVGWGSVGLSLANI